MLVKNYNGLIGGVPSIVWCPVSSFPAPPSPNSNRNSVENKGQFLSIRRGWGGKCRNVAVGSSNEDKIVQRVKVKSKKKRATVKPPVHSNAAS